MALPKSIRISGHNYEVRETEKSSELGGGGYMGSWRESEMFISVKAGMGESMKEETLIHEMIEIIFHSVLEQSKIPHGVIQSLSSILYQSLKDSGLLTFPLEFSRWIFPKWKITVNKKGEEILSPVLEDTGIEPVLNENKIKKEGKSKNDQ